MQLIPTVVLIRISMVQNMVKTGKNGKNDQKKGYPANFEALYLEKSVHDPMFFFIESIEQHP